MTLWEQWIFAFAAAKALCHLAPFIPTSGQSLLSTTVYELALVSLLDENPKATFKAIRQWPADLYSLPRVLEAVENRLRIQPDDMQILEIAAEL